ncbi:hypothetical protein FRC02_003147 [Tulasnella sp. 418]|nr:hypothetical protein FRC02_003147 [Tulasnella sp. 418]
MSISSDTGSRRTSLQTDPSPRRSPAALQPRSADSLTLGHAQSPLATTDGSIVALLATQTLMVQITTLLSLLQLAPEVLAG